MQQQSSVYGVFTTKSLRLATVGLTCLGCLLGGQSPQLLAQTTASQPALSQPGLSQETASGETIVYVKDGARELRLIQPDGSDDRLLWRVPDSVIGRPIAAVRWRPDAQQIAFTSSHEATCSEYAADIYLINPDGSNLQRLTNAPACGQLASFAQGSASVQVENRLANYSEYLVYIEGAPSAKVVTIAPNSSVLVAFPQVADLGAGVMQAAVAINGASRWFDAGVMTDVVAGQNAHAGKLTITGGGFTAYGASHISWNPAGSQLAYQFGQGRLWQVGLDVPILAEGGPLLDPQTTNKLLGTHPTWSPVGNQVLYQRFDTRPSTITQAEVGATDPGTALAQVVLISGIAWLGDGSGMVVADDDSLLAHTDLYRMTFADNMITQLTQTTGRQVAAEPGISPDSSQIVYTYAEDARANPLNPQLRIMNSDGSGDHLLVEGGRVADWSRVAPQNPPATPAPTATPEPTATTQQSTPGVTPDVTPGITPGVTPSITPSPSATPLPNSTAIFTVYLPSVRR